MKKRKIILGAISAILVLILAGLVVVSVVIPQKKTYETSNIDEYGQYDGHIPAEKSELGKIFVFPNELTDNMKVENYNYYCDTSLFDNQYRIFLQVVCDDETFQEEQTRLSEISSLKYGEIQYNETDFFYPAYVMRKDDYGTYEYALLDKENNRIVYVYYTSKAKGIDKQYLPK